MAIFEDCAVVLDLKNVSYKEKKKLMSAIVNNGGNISYIVNQKCSFVVTTSLETLSNSRQRNSLKHHTPVVSQEYVWSCLEKGCLLPVENHVLKQVTSAPTSEPHPGLKSRDLPQFPSSGMYQGQKEIKVKDGKFLGKFRSDEENDDTAEFPSHFQVAKYSIFEKDQPKVWSVLELQSAKGQAGQRYHIVKSIMHEAEKTVTSDKQMHSSSSEDAIEVYQMLSKELQAQGFTQTQTLPSWAEELTSHGLQQLLLEEKINCSTVSKEIGFFVELIWTEAHGSLNKILMVPVTSLSLNDVSRVEGLLLQTQKSENDEEVKALLEQVDSLLPLRMAKPDSKNKLVSQKLDLCQLIRDILNMTEATLGNPSPSSLGKYRALRCSIEQVPSQSPEFLCVSQLLHDRPAQIQQILRVNRGAELHMFREELGNVKNLLHSSAPSSFVGILSRGLLLPRIGVEQHGIQRTDVGNLGGGIYFSDSLNTSLKYSKPSETDGSRLLLVCDVALGRCKDLHSRNLTLTCAPEDFDSVHGVRRTQNISSDFEDDEYVVYNTDQVRLKYVVQYILNEDQVKDFHPYVNTTIGNLRFGTISDALSNDDSEDLDLTKNPLEDVTAGLLDSSGQTLPLKAVHVRCKLMDLLSQVIIFQTYTNNSDIPIEAKYVFPLEETAAVCGFEAFINGKHVIGKVKEKEQARKEYKQAIEKGHGAYLMDQDAPDVFTISVGNLPPGATVLIKVTFITELVVRAGTILFSLPGSVAPWQQSAALNQRTQTTVEKVCVNELQPDGEFSLSMSIEMPYEITDLECSHRYKIKTTDCTAVVSTLPDQTLNADGFRFSFSLSQIHMPRMWVEKHPEKDTEACMLVFYPHFETGDFSSSGLKDLIILLDTSESMRGEAMLNARRIALKLLKSLDRSVFRVNIIFFGTDYYEAYLSPKLLMEAYEPAKNFITSSIAVGGSTELWRPLRSLNLLPPSNGVRNVLLLSDGHVQNQPQTLEMVRDNARHTRLFTCGLSTTANRHMLRALAQAGGGTSEFFDTKTKHTWAEKVHSMVRCMEAPGCSSVAVKWQQFSLTAPPPVQAPSQLCALFSDCHTLVYGFVPHCTQATLFGDLSGQELKTMVSTTELQKTKGTFLHKLTARAIIRDYEDGSLASSEAEHEGKKVELKSYIIELSKEFSILSQFTSFVAIEERDKDQPDSGFTDVPKIVAEEDVDILPYMGWTEDDSHESFEVDFEEYDEGKPMQMECLENEADPYDFCKLDLVKNDFRSDEPCFSSLYAAKAFQPFSSNLYKVMAEEASFSGQTMHIEFKRSERMADECSDESESSEAAESEELQVTETLSSEILCSLGSAESENFRSDGLFRFDLESCSVPQFKSTAPPAPDTSRVADTASLDKPVDFSFRQRQRPDMEYRMKSRRAFHFPTILPSQARITDIEPDSDQSATLLGQDRVVPWTSGFQFNMANLCGPTVFSSKDTSTGTGTAFFGGAAPASSLSVHERPFGRIGMGYDSASRIQSVPFSASCSSEAMVESDSVPFFGAASFELASFAGPSPGAIEQTYPEICGPHSPLSSPPPPPPPPRHLLHYLQSQHISNALPKPCSKTVQESDLSYLSTNALPGPLPMMFSSLRTPHNLLTLEGGVANIDNEKIPMEIKRAISLKKRKKLAQISLDSSEERCSLELDVSGLFQRAESMDQGRQPEEINWKELFGLQHQDGYWECTGMLSKYLGLDVDYFANVFMKERGICSLGAKAHTDILRLVATMLVLQLMRVRKMADKDLFQSLLRLINNPEPKPENWDAVKRAVDWACWADREYPCVCSRLELGWDWESCTRQLLGLDSLPACSPLIPLLQRNTRLTVM